METLPESEAFGVVTCYHNGLEVRGYGMQKSYYLPYAGGTKEEADEKVEPMKA